jgi:hypothetical protein
MLQRRPGLTASVLAQLPAHCLIRVAYLRAHGLPQACWRQPPHHCYRADMCGRFTYELTWPEIVKLYRLSLDTAARNMQPRYNICPTTQIDTVIGRGARVIVPMRWGIIPS